MKNPLDKVIAEFPQKFASERDIIGHIHRGDRIFIASACGEPQYLVNALIRYTESYPKSFFDEEQYPASPFSGGQAFGKEYPGATCAV